MADSQSWSAFGSPATPSSADANGSAADPPEPAYGPAPPAGPGRASFGFTAGPISGNHNSGRTAPTPGAKFPPAVQPPVSQPPVSQPPVSRPAEPRSPETRMPEPRSSEPRMPEPRSPETRSSAPHPVRSVTAESVLARSRQPRLQHAVAEDEGIGDFIGGPGREIRPHRAARHPHATGEQAILAGPPPRGRGVFLAGVALSAAVLLGGVVAGVSYFSGPDKSLTSVLELGAGTPEDRTVTAPVDGRKVASFELATATTKMTMRSEDLGEDLYRISTAEDAGILPNAVVEQDRVQLKLVPGGDGGSGEVEVVLSSKVMWNLRLAGAVDEQRINFTGGAIGAIDLIGGSRVTEIALPEPAGTVALKITGEVDELALTSPEGNPVRVKMRGGAKTVAAGARTLRDVEPGSTLTPKGWATNDRYDVTAEARVTLLSVETVE
ncbi:hypothetical protein [Actinoplanes sp. NPDC049118]|uniref:hypothetical protein n=1 Tax=Actinoplanes sp. NPDC049118 TaxID=3155769 RepID=UPI003402937F